jgi:hypothetical protein
LSGPSPIRRVAYLNAAAAVTDPGRSGRLAPATEVDVIYSVVPHELGEDVYNRLVERYKDNPNITVIMDRRKGDRRKDKSGGGGRETRDRRRRRLPGSFDV